MLARVNVAPLLYQEKKKKAKQIINSFIHSLFTEHALYTYSVPGIVLRSGDETVNDIDFAFTDTKKRERWEIYIKSKRKKKNGP